MSRWTGTDSVKLGGGDLENPLSSSALRTLGAIADRIIPGDDFPSATQSGTIEFICGLLDRDMPERWPELVDGLERVDAHSVRSHGSAFSDLPNESQDALLRSIEAGDDLVARAFFAWLVQIVNEGYYADPANGGNTDAASWKMLGYDPRVPGYNGKNE